MCHVYNYVAVVISPSAVCLLLEFFYYSDIIFSACLLNNNGVKAGVKTGAFTVSGGG